MNMLLSCRARLCVVMLCAMPVLASQALAQAAEPLPTIEQLKQSLQANKPQEVLSGVAKILAIRGEAAKAYDRYELFSLRGEAYLRNKAMPPAAEAFVNAAKETTDPQKQASARANEILIRKSKATGYLPKPAPRTPGAAATKPSGPMPIVEPADRKEAMVALFTDERRDRYWNL